MYKLVFFVPTPDAEAVKNALFDSGAGRQGNYSHCCWETSGTGQFRPLAGSEPHIGQQGVLERVEELRIELLVDDGLIENVVKALRASHPYEEPAFEVYQIETF